MASSSKTLVEIFQPAKRLKSLTIPPETLTPKSSMSALCKPSPTDGATSGSDLLPPSTLTPDQKKRIEINKALARSKRNLRLCTEKIERAKAVGMDYVKLEEILVEETWLEALPGELQKPYAKNLCRFVEREVRGSVPIYPPPCLIFNALHSTPFDRAKAVILGQDPYHGPDQTMGLAFSVPEGIKMPSSLVNIFKELQKDVGCSVPLHGNLERWAVQGVLLLNTVLTVSSFSLSLIGKEPSS
ncbi:uracil-DNA glycosylase, mitochondrial-like isoform X2 [Phoenix dactylifera]|uniref:Uracil-DNA glycosylase, mitochondrial-like isoform X2 n=1 Tax=Phoenix dactylifera TaxID=42345 RepID=A0A8B8ZGT7_PHODC|nr:uracil-DNA glycosylase, mitochondrial-like isoform X2 [Phoenix dactylifera]XP_038971020.1 uracil-DNA glycosylase, mitochondrial-like isoform X2 [Phoenix dactylifera]